MKQHHNFKEMTPDDIISTFQLFEESKANATKHLAMHGTSTSKINLALKAEHEYDEEESESSPQSAPTRASSKVEVQSLPDTCWR